MSRAVIFVNGELPDLGAARGLVHTDDFIVATDGGARYAIKLGLIPHVIIGDMDSLSEAEVRVFTDMGVNMLRFPPVKDETDLELALGHTLKAGHHPIVIIGALGGRLDQTIGNISLLSGPETLAVDVRIDDGLTEAFFVSGKASLRGTAGDTVSLLPWGNPAEGVSTDGLCYPLNQETLYPHRTRGVSNQMLAKKAQISLKSGILLCVHHREPS